MFCLYSKGVRRDRGSLSFLIETFRRFYLFFKNVYKRFYRIALFAQFLIFPVDILFYLLKRFFDFSHLVFHFSRPKFGLIR